MKPCKIVLLVSDDLTYKNTGLLFPILDKKAKLSDNGFDINIIFNEPDKVEECDRYWSQIRFIRVQRTTTDYWKIYPNFDK